MKHSLTFAMLALAAFAFGMSAFDTSAEARIRGRHVAIGLGAAAATAIILSGAARADERRRYRRYSCADLYDMCSEGRDWACHKYERRCE